MRKHHQPQIQPYFWEEPDFLFYVIIGSRKSSWFWQIDFSVFKCRIKARIKKKTKPTSTTKNL